MKKLTSARNVLLLPGTESPERMTAKFLYNISDEDPLWDSLSEGYTKQFCFREISYQRIFAEGEKGRQDAKKWFNQQIQHWGWGGLKVLNPLFAEMQQEVDTFIVEYNRILSHYIHD